MSLSVNLAVSCLGHGAAFGPVAGYFCPVLTSQRFEEYDCKAARPDQQLQVEWLLSIILTQGKVHGVESREARSKLPRSAPWGVTGLST